MELNFSEPPESGFFLRCFLSVCFLVQYVLFQSDPYALFPQGCSNVKKFPTQAIKHMMFQWVQSLPEWLETKFIFFSMLALVYNPPYLLPRAQAHSAGKKFPNCAFPRTTREDHSPPLMRLFVLFRVAYQNEQLGKKLALKLRDSSGYLQSHRIPLRLNH